ncbi:MAG: hypothetical protein AAGJ18_08720 [Bacteroidota bacterium]
MAIRKRLIIGCYSLLLLLSSCDLINPAEPLPAYLQIDDFPLTTTAEQGQNAEQITDVWVFVNDISLGIYELPATISTLDLGTQDITIFPVVRENGLRSTPIIYPFYNRYETTVELKTEQTVQLQPTTTYIENAVFELVEDFGGSGHQLRGGNASAVQIVDNVGQVNFADQTVTEFTSSSTFVDLPTSGNRAVFLEFDYQTNVELAVGLVGLDVNGGSIVATSYKIILCPIDRWNRIYVNFQEDLELSQLTGYRLAFRATTNDTGCGNVNATNPEVLLDNVKFIRLAN